MKRLLLVAGPSTAGKSTLIDAFCTGQLPALTEYLGIDPANGLYIEAYQLPASRWRETDILVLHYDFHRQYHNQSFRHIDELFAHFETVEVLLLQSSAYCLFWRNTWRMAELLLQIMKFSKPGYRKNLRATLAREWLYLKPAATAGLYQKFLQCLEGNSCKAVYTINTSGFSLDPARALRQRIRDQRRFQTPVFME